ncbi:MAG: endonuclease, partial [Bacteroidota bacterium]|nr:endonuclease [Bacteroidota bacterium]
KLDGGTFWLSATPEKAGSRSWNAACNRIVTWVKLKDKNSGEILFYFNTHFDHQSVLAREKSAELLKIRVHQIARQQQVIVTGDFNDNRKSQAYRILTEGDDKLSNTADQVVLKESNPDYSFIGFPFQKRHGEIIDFVFMKNMERWKPYTQRIITYNVDGKYPSDHLPVLTEFSAIKNKKIKK